MAYVLSAVVASTAFFTRREGGPAVELRQGLSLMPLSLAAGAEHDYLFLPPGFAGTLAMWSHDAPVAYVEAEIFGGTGIQNAAVWHYGHLILGPLHLAEGEPFPAAGSPISQALRQLGAQAETHFDEFEAVGLGRHRSTSGWLAEAGL